VAHASPI